jgi:hypothetical protein
MRGSFAPLRMTTFNYATYAWFCLQISDFIAMRNRIANPHKQQIPPLRCAPVGMINYLIHFRDGTLVRVFDGAAVGAGAGDWYWFAGHGCG